MSMVVILESRHTSTTATQPFSMSGVDDEVIGPSTFYIEEITDTLDHLRSGGVENLANTWLQCNKRPEVNAKYTTHTHTQHPHSPSFEKFNYSWGGCVLLSVGFYFFAFEIYPLFLSCAICRLKGFKRNHSRWFSSGCQCSHEFTGCQPFGHQENRNHIDIEATP